MSEPNIEQSVYDLQLRVRALELATEEMDKPHLPELPKDYEYYSMGNPAITPHPLGSMCKGATDNWVFTEPNDIAHSDTFFIRPIPGTWTWAKVQGVPVCKGYWHKSSAIAQSAFGSWHFIENNVKYYIYHGDEIATDWQIY